MYHLPILRTVILGNAQLFIINFFSSNLIYKCNFKPSFSKPVLPNISSDKGGNADKNLIEDSNEGLKEKFIRLFKAEEENLNQNLEFKKAIFTNCNYRQNDKCQSQAYAR